MRAAIGSQCKQMNRGVTSILFGSLKLILLPNSGLIVVRWNWLEDLPRKHCNSQVWTEQEPEQGVEKHVPVSETWQFSLKGIIYDFTGNLDRITVYG